MERIEGELKEIDTKKDPKGALQKLKSIYDTIRSVIDLLSDFDRLINL